LPEAHLSGATATGQDVWSKGRGVDWDCGTTVKLSPRNPKRQDSGAEYFLLGQGRSRDIKCRGRREGRSRRSGRGQSLAQNKIKVNLKGSSAVLQYGWSDNRAGGRAIAPLEAAQGERDADSGSNLVGGKPRAQGGGTTSPLGKGVCPFPGFKRLPANPDPEVSFSSKTVSRARRHARPTKKVAPRPSPRRGRTQDPCRANYASILGAGCQRKPPLLSGETEKMNHPRGPTFEVRRSVGITSSSVWSGGRSRCRASSSGLLQQMGGGEDGEQTLSRPSE